MYRGPNRLFHTQYLYDMLVLSICNALFAAEDMLCSLVMHSHRARKNLCSLNLTTYMYIDSTYTEYIAYIWSRVRLTESAFAPAALISGSSVLAIYSSCVRIAYVLEFAYVCCKAGIFLPSFLMLSCAAILSMNWVDRELKTGPPHL